MAINAIVFYSPDRRIRITTAAGRGNTYRVERDLVLVAEFRSLPLLEGWLREQGIDFADLIQD